MWATAVFLEKISKSSFIWWFTISLQYGQGFRVQHDRYLGNSKSGPGGSDGSKNQLVELGFRHVTVFFFSKCPNSLLYEWEKRKQRAIATGAKKKGWARVSKSKEIQLEAENIKQIMFI